MRRRARGLVLIVLVLLGLASGQSATAAPQFPYPWPDYSVVPVLFVPTDWSVSSDEVQEEAAALRSAMNDIQRFYGDNVNGNTFTLNRLQVVQALHPKESYHIIWNGRNIYEDGVEFDGNLEHEVVAELQARGYPTPPAQNESGYSVLIFVKGAGGWAGAREFPDADGGWAILGDWAIDSIQGDVPEGAYWWSGRRKQIGAAAHELGHTFDLPHPDAYGYPWESTIMGAWWDYPTPGLNDWERDRLLTVKLNFFTRTALQSPGSTSITKGILRGGSASALHRDDEVYFEVNSTTLGTTSWYAKFGGVPNSLRNLKATYKGKNSRPCTQSLAIWNWRTGAWVRFDQRTVGVNEVEITKSVPGASPGQYVSGGWGNGQLRLRVRCQRDSGFFSSGDMMKIVYDRT